VDKDIVSIFVADEVITFDRVKPLDGSLPSKNAPYMPGMVSCVRVIAKRFCAVGMHEDIAYVRKGRHER
jgi:hypothetical protein